MHNSLSNSIYNIIIMSTSYKKVKQDKLDAQQPLKIIDMQSTVDGYCWAIEFSHVTSEINAKMCS